ncbi:MAG: hypothetical protein GYB65_02330 [Chloroflexi bacterium]|nr:hypothetical protein [Chloroflexota bacterium]
MASPNTYGIQKLPDGPITLYTATRDAHLRVLALSNQALRDVLDAQSDPVIHIADMRAAQLSFQDMITLAANAAWGQNALFRHPMIREVLIVTRDEVLCLTAQSLTSDSYGTIPIRLFSNLSEALAYARSQFARAR